MKPILFSTPMVQAILSGSKTMTRRIIKPQPNDNGVSYMPNAPLDWEQVYKEDWKPWKFETDEGEYFSKFCPYGEPGDILWVRETWQPWLRGEGVYGWVELIKFKADGFELPVKHLKDYSKSGWHDRPAIYLHQKYARLFLKIKSIRVERLSNISEADAKAEGVEIIKHENGRPLYKPYGTDHYGFARPSNSFCTLWNQINGPGSWDINPWVWVIEFERTEKPTAN